MQGQIHITVLFKPISQDPSWGAGVLGSSKDKEEEVQDGEVPHSYFPMRSGCRVTMYNDAHQVSSTADMYSPTLKRYSLFESSVLHH